MKRARVMMTALVLCCAGCPAGHGGGAGGVAPLNAASLPSDPAKLIQVADEQYDKGRQGVQNSVTALQAAVDKAPSYDAYWRLSRAYAELSDTDNAEIKAKMSAAGVAAGRKAMELGPDKVEGPYYLAQNIGYSVQSNKGENKELVNEVVQLAEKARGIDAKFDHGGPARLLGALYAKAPAPPISIGDPDKAVKLMQEALQLDPAFPANSLYLAEALLADERYQDADAALKKARGGMADAQWARWKPTWEAEATRIQKKLAAKQGG